MKKILLLIVILIAIGAAAYGYLKMSGTIQVEQKSADTEEAGSQAVAPKQGNDVPEGTVAPAPSKPATFSGKLESVNTGCVGGGRGECFVMVDGKRVVVVPNAPADLTGVIVGVPTFMDLAGKIGSTVEVYAMEKSTGTYSLYGSNQFYIKLK